MEAIPTPDLAVPYAAPISVRNCGKLGPKNTEPTWGRIHLLAKHKAAVTPINPKKGADVGQFSWETFVSLIFEQS
jgi:hypothetical protein